MALTALGHIVAIVVGAWFAALLLLIAVKTFSGEIVTTGVLALPGRPLPTVGRMQMVLATIVVAVGYAGAALVRAPGDALPDVPTGIVLALLGSHGIYLGEKYARGGRGERG